MHLPTLVLTDMLGLFLVCRSSMKWCTHLNFSCLRFPTQRNCPGTEVLLLTAICSDQEISPHAMEVQVSLSDDINPAVSLEIFLGAVGGLGNCLCSRNLNPVKIVTASPSQQTTLTLVSRNSLQQHVCEVPLNGYPFLHQH